MRPFHTALISTLALTLAAPAVAQSTGFYYDGFVAFDYLDSSGGGSGDAAGLIDMSFGIAPNSGDSFGGVGFEFGVWAYTVSGGSTEATAYAAATFALGGGVLHVGAPRSAVHGYNTTPIPTGARAGLVEAGIYTGALPYSLTLAIGADRPVLGVLYERESGPLRYSASYGQLNDSGTVHVAALAAEREFGNSRVFGTVEHLWAGSNSATTVVLGGSTTFGGGSSSLGPIEVGGAVSYLETGGTATALSLYATASPTERLDLTASLLHLSTGGSQTIYGVNAGYDIWNGVVLNAGVAGTSTGSGTIWTVGLSRDF